MSDIYIGSRYENYFRASVTTETLPTIPQTEETINLDNVKKFSMISLIRSTKDFEDIVYTRKFLKIIVSTEKPFIYGTNINNNYLSFICVDVRSNEETKER